jgi:hypothetical protein
MRPWSPRPYVGCVRGLMGAGRGSPSGETWLTRASVKWQFPAEQLQQLSTSAVTAVPLSESSALTAQRQQTASCVVLGRTAPSRHRA